MTVSSSTAENGPYLADGSQTSFPRTFLLKDEAHIEVVQTVNGVDTVIETGFSQTGIGTAAGAVVFSTPPASGSTITLSRNVPIEQQTDYTDQGVVAPETIEDDLDLIVMMMQELGRDRSAAFKLAAGKGSAAPLAATAAERAQKLLGFDGDGDLGLYEVEDDEAVTAPYANRAAAVAANVPVVVHRLSVLHNGILLHYARDASSTALTTADGATWGPASKLAFFEHWGLTPKYLDLDTLSFTSGAAVTVGTFMSGETDASATVNAALSEHVGAIQFTGYLRIDNQVTLHKECALLGIPGARASCGFALFSNFDMTVSHCIVGDTADPGVFLDGFTIYHDQPSGPTGRAGLTNYPWTLDLSASARGRIPYLRIVGATNGIDMRDAAAASNPGGMEIGTLEISALGEAVMINSALDFVKIDSLRSWPFMISGFQSSVTLTCTGTVSVSVGTFVSQPSGGARGKVQTVTTNGGITTLVLENGTVDGSFNATEQLTTTAGSLGASSVPTNVSITGDGSLRHIFTDGRTVGFRSEKCDGLVADAITCWKTRAVFGRPALIELNCTGDIGWLMVGETITQVSTSLVSAGSFQVGVPYSIVDLGSTDWNVVAGTTGVTYNVGDVVLAAAAGSGTGTAHQAATGTLYGVIAGPRTVARVQSVAGSFNTTNQLSGSTSGALGADSVPTSTAQLAALGETEITQNVSNLVMDASRSYLELRGGKTQMHVYTSKVQDEVDSTIVCSSGLHQMSIDCRSSTDNAILVTGGTLQINGGLLYSQILDTTMARVTGGRLELNDVTMQWPDSAPSGSTPAFIEQADQGQLHVSGCTTRDMQNTRTIVEVGADNLFNSIFGNRFGPHQVDYPASATRGKYEGTEGSLQYTEDATTITRGVLSDTASHSVNDVARRARGDKSGLTAVVAGDDVRYQTSEAYDGSAWDAIVQVRDRAFGIASGAVRGVRDFFISDTAGSLQHIVRFFSNFLILNGAFGQNMARSTFVTRNAAGDFSPMVDGTIVTVGRLRYERDASDTSITDLNGFKAVDPEVDHYGTGAQAITDMVADQDFVRFNTPFILTSDVTVTKPLIFGPGAYLQVNDLITLTLEAPIEADHYQHVIRLISSGAAVINRQGTSSELASPTEIYAPWFGVTAGQVADQSPDFNKLIAALVNGDTTESIIHIPQGRYRLWTAVSALPRACWIRGAGNRRTTIDVDYANYDVFTTTDILARWSELNFELTNDATSPTGTTSGVRSNGAFINITHNEAMIDNCRFEGADTNVVATANSCQFNKVHGIWGTTGHAANTSCMILLNGSGHQVIDTESETTGATDLHALIRIVGGDDIVVDGVTNNSGCISVEIDTTSAAVNNPAIKGVNGDGPGADSTISLHASTNAINRPRILDWMADSNNTNGINVFADGANLSGLVIGHGQCGSVTTGIVLNAGSGRTIDAIVASDVDLSDATNGITTPGAGTVNLIDNRTIRVTFTPSFDLVAAPTTLTATGVATKRGRDVSTEIVMTWTGLDTTDTSVAVVDGLPWDVAASSMLRGNIDQDDSTGIAAASRDAVHLFAAATRDQFAFKNGSAVNVTYNSGEFQASGTLKVSFSYETDTL